jgi:hypothetical protein
MLAHRHLVKVAEARKKIGLMTSYTSLASEVLLSMPLLPEGFTAAEQPIPQPQTIEKKRRARKSTPLSQRAPAPVA